MFLALVKKEILNNLLNFRFVLVYFICTFLLVSSFAVVLTDFLTEKKTYEKSASIYRARNNQVYPVCGWEYIKLTKQIAREPTVLKLFAVGGERDANGKAMVRYDRSPLFRGEFKKNPLANLFLPLDMVTLIGILAGLIIIVLMYDAISGEREEGTLRLILSCPVPRDLVITAKWLGGFVSLLMPFIISWLIIVLMLVFSPALQLSGEQLTRIALIFLLCTVYIAAVFSISFFVSTIARSSSASVIILLCVWTIFIVVIPGLSSPLAFVAADRPGIGRYEVDANRAGIEGKDRTIVETDTAFVALHADSIPLEQWVKVQVDIAWKWLFLTLDSIPLAGAELSRSQEEGDRMVRWINRLSPYGCLQNAAVALAGTGLPREIAFRKALTDYYVVTTRLVQHLDNGPYDPGRGPQYTYLPRRLDSELFGALLEVAILVTIAGGFFLLSYAVFLKKEII